jgi:hypothetical protein
MGGKNKILSFNIISSILHNLIHMAGILQMAVFLKSRPFSKFHPFYIGISNIPAISLVLKKDEITKKQPFAKFQPFTTKLSHIHHFPHLPTTMASSQPSAPSPQPPTNSRSLFPLLPTFLACLSRLPLHCNLLHYCRRPPPKITASRVSMADNNSHFLDGIAIRGVREADHSHASRGGRAYPKEVREMVISMMLRGEIEAVNTPAINQLHHEKKFLCLATCRKWLRQYLTNLTLGHIRPLRNAGNRVATQEISGRR